MTRQSVLRVSAAVSPVRGAAGRWYRWARCRPGLPGSPDPETFSTHGSDDPSSALREGEEQRQRQVARYWCKPCPVRAECLVDAVAEGAWGVIRGGFAFTRAGRTDLLSAGGPDVAA